MNENFSAITREGFYIPMSILCSLHIVLLESWLYFDTSIKVYQTVFTVNGNLGHRMIDLDSEPANKNKVSGEMGDR